MRIITATLLVLAALAAPARADEENIPAHTTLTPGFGGGWFHAHGRYGSGLLLQAKLERATGGRLEWQADYAISDWSSPKREGGGALWQRLGGGVNYAVGHMQMARNALWDITLGIGAGVQLIRFEDDNVRIARADVAIALGLRQLFDMNNSRGRRVWYGMAADVRLLVSPTPDGLDVGIMASYGMTLGR